MAKPYLSAVVQREILEVEMTLAVVESDDRSEALDLDQLQLEQFKHDEVYHREIARLSTQDRLKHMALHFAKYAGNLVESDDDAVVQKTLTDTFIIAVSTANTLNLRLSDVVGANEHPLDNRNFAQLLAIYAGRMAAACEKLDHLEDFPFRPIIRESTISLLHAAAHEADCRGWNITDLVRARLAGVKQKMIFHGRLPLRFYRLPVHQRRRPCRGRSGPHQVRSGQRPRRGPERLSFVWNGPLDV